MSIIRVKFISHIVRVVYQARLNDKLIVKAVYSNQV